MKKLSILTLFLLLILSFPNQFYGQKVGQNYVFDVNKIKLPIDNEGKMNTGIYDSLSFLFSSGFLISGQDGDLIWTNSSKAFVNHFTPGTYNIDSSDSRSVIYRVRKNDPPFGQSWQEWSGAVQLGAYFYDGNGDHIYNPVDLNGNNQWDPDEDKPDIIGDETLWCAYNDSHPGGIYNLWQSVPRGIEIKQTIFAYSGNQAPLANAIFVRYRIINNGSVKDTLKNVIFGNFPDNDLGENHYDDYGATDTLRNAMIIYNDAFDDSGGYGADPPAFLLAMLNGPYSYIPGVSFNDVNGNGNYDEGIDIPLDTAISYLGELGINIIPGASNLNISAATHYSRAYPGEDEPRDSLQARNLMQGKNRNGEYPDPCTYSYGEVRGGINCADVNPVFWYSGDPVIDEGWIHTIVGDVRSIMSTGPLTLVKNKPVNILYGYIVGRGTDNLNSITVGRSYLDQIQELVNNNFGYPMVVSVKDD
ncbi:MAG TPA: hypothetical protein VLB50_06155, partial [Ignavibacteriaceae bacterium]|nr:hypothetical protein [Ignavibacteriaceae bacterium]